MRLTRLLKSRVFLLSLLSSALFVSAMVLTVGFLYWSSINAVSRQIDATIDAEIKGLAEQYDPVHGPATLIQALRSRSSRRGRPGALYLLATADGHPLAGNISRWPKVKPDPKGWITFDLTYQQGKQSKILQGRARVFRLRGGLRLLVGHDTREQARVTGVMTQTFIWAGLVALFLALALGVLLAWLILRRIDAITATSREIMAGDLSHRVPVTGRSDEFDRLANSLNGMLEQNERLFRGMREVTENIAHDLRSPLGRLRQRMERIQSDSLTNSQKSILTDEAIGEADRLLRTFNAILSIAQAESGAPRRNFEKIDLTVMLLDLAELYAPLADEAGLKFEAIYPDEPISVIGDPDLLFQACANIVDNALNYGAGGKEISITLLSGAGQAQIGIRDKGQGMSLSERRRATDRFFRADASRTTGGTGLGLSLADAVARLHGGSIRLDDNRPGLAVILTLPLDKSPVRTDKTAGEKEAQGSTAEWSPSTD